MATKPISSVTGPCANRGVQPSECQHRKKRADHFMEKLLERAPQPAEAAEFDSCAAASWQRRTCLYLNVKDIPTHVVLGTGV